MNMKKLVSILVCVAMLLCFAGCSKKDDSSSANNKPAVSDTPETAGVLFLSIGTEFKIIYDTDGLVVAVDGINSTANDVLMEYDSTVGTACDEVVSELISRSIAAGKHPYTRVVVIKQAPDSESPSAAFLENVRIDAAAATDFEVVLILASELTADGYITAEAAKDILSRQVKMDNLLITCSEPENDAYTLTFEVDGGEQEYKINAITGTVILPSLPSDTEILDINENNDPLDMGEPDQTPDDHFGDPAYDDILDAPQEGN